MDRKPIIAISVGDPAGIGPEISLKAALDASVRAVARPVLVGDPAIIERHAAACGIAPDWLVLDELNGAVTDSRMRSISAPTSFNLVSIFS